MKGEGVIFHQHTTIKRREGGGQEGEGEGAPSLYIYCKIILNTSAVRFDTFRVDTYRSKLRDTPPARFCRCSYPMNMCMTPTISLYLLFSLFSSHMICPRDGRKPQTHDGRKLQTHDGRKLQTHTWYEKIEYKKIRTAPTFVGNRLGVSIGQFPQYLLKVIRKAGGRAGRAPSQNRLFYFLSHCPCDGITLPKRKNLRNNSKEGGGRGEGEGKGALSHSRPSLCPFSHCVVCPDDRRTKSNTTMKTHKNVPFRTPKSPYSISE